jgi:small subunit ribosomal protein S13
MAIISGVNIPDGKRLEVALRSIHGIGPTSSIQISKQANINGNPRVQELDQDELSRLREVIDKNYKVEGDLKREVQGNIRRLIDIGSYRGLRHRRGLPSRGQQTQTNSRTRRAGSRRAISGRGRTVKK